jgi:hypothetical protein
MVNYLNGYLTGKGIRPIGLNTYYFWERIGLPGQDKGRAYPHPYVYRLLSIVLGISISAIIGYFTLDKNQLKRHSSDDIRDLCIGLSRQQKLHAVAILSQEVWQQHQEAGAN